MKILSIGIVVGLMAVSAEVGFFVGRDTAPVATQLSAARSLAGFNANLIGYDCDDHRTVVLATEEDEFPERGCKEILRLNDTEPFL